MEKSDKQPSVHLVVVAGTLVTIVWLVEHDLISLLTWTARLVPVGRYRWLFGIYFACFASVEMAPIRWRRIVLLFGSLATGAVFSPAFVTVSVAWVVCYHGILRVRVPGAAKFALILATFAVWMAVCHVTLGPRLVGHHPIVPFLGYAFATSYTFRIFWSFHEFRLLGFPRVPFLDLALYFLFAPFFVIVPYMLAIPRFGTFASSLDSPDPRVVRSGVVCLLVGACLTTAVTLAARVFNPQVEFVALLRQGRFALALPFGILYYPVQSFFASVGNATILLGLVRTLGVALPPAFNNPLASKSVPEWWRRWNTHFREFLVDLFYTPVMLRLRRGNAYLGIVAGCFSVFVIGSSFFHFLAKGYFAYGVFRFPLALLAENVAMAIIVAVALSLEKRRRSLRTGLLAPVPRVRRFVTTGANVFATYALVFVCIVVINRGISYARDIAACERGDAACLTRERDEPNRFEEPSAVPNPRSSRKAEHR